MNLRKLGSRGIFITATDTSVGKTTVAAGMIGYLKRLGYNVGVMKPVASGAIETEAGRLISQDAEMLVKFSGSEDPWEWINPYCFSAAVTPALAARIEGVTIDFGRIRECFHQMAERHDLVVVEGAGGVLSPVFEKLYVADLISLLELPVMIVSRAALGTINHTLMTCEALRSRNLRTVGFFLNRFPRTPNLSESTNAEIISSLSGLPHLGSIPEMDDFFSQQDVINTFSSSVNQERLMDVLGG
ncbi:MAG: dethiobiotin synthase [Acidobacteriota bacterium]